MTLYPWIYWTISVSLLWQQNLLADAALDPMPTREQGLWQTLSMVFIALAFFYFILWRPEQKRRQAIENQRATLKKGDRVTAMGILGTITAIQDQTVILRMYDGSKIECLKAAITEVAPHANDKEHSAEEGQKHLPSS